MNKNLKDDLIKISVDKFLIGLILILLGNLATNLVEKFKSERSFSFQLNQRRVEKISEVWEKVYLYEAATEEDVKQSKTKRIYVEPREFTDEAFERATNETLQNIRQAYKQSDSLRIELISLTNKNRFWLGEESYSEIQNYVQSTLDYLYAIENQNDEKIKALSELRNKSRANIRQIRDKLLDE
jgi:hypothetical protein